ncbi:hypothetical protein A3B56_02205 [Candidatus Roizmanbacteria bacterium RIFCSPLOWO2_01_FULL_45_11]|uniref:PIN domain-containing protein n=1 Tax=Candidatus Roizmanbacteria bacterium RIFCSPLOWO2_01_FULL_45_11 TaxID=1802070 RepID=A0A1F7JDZ1_9BACT|nr:MAG: hypothetical protein A3B56_02205 [Candidatus Roizmanbacteria bacterium RIFCSPLOWO2_01_FULL_45_11]
MPDGNTEFVVDASYILTYLLPDEKDDSARKIILQYQNKKISLCSSGILTYEVGNALVIAIRRNRISSQIGQNLLRGFVRLNIEEKVVLHDHCLSYAQQTNLTYYDASYALLAQDLHIPLLTWDKKLDRISKNNT